MKLVYAWKNSLSLFQLSTAKLLLFAMIKSIKTTSYLCILYFWWLVPVMALGYSIMYSYSDEHVYNVLISTLMDLFHYSTLIIIFVSARPSIKRKDFDYYKGYLSRLPFIILFLISTFIIKSFGPALVESSDMYQMNAWILAGMIIYTLVANIWFDLSFLFFLDAATQLKAWGSSMFRAAKMILYNAPLLLLISIVAITVGYYIKYAGNWAEFYLISYASTKYTMIIIAMMKWVLLVINSIISVSIFTTLYVKRLYDQYELYFPKN